MSIDAYGNYIPDPSISPYFDPTQYYPGVDPYQTQTTTPSPAPAAAPSTATASAPASTTASPSTTPSYVNITDPVQAAVWGAYSTKGIAPRDQSDFQYWVDKINTTNGGWTNPQNQQYWLGRMAQTSGGVGDYSTGGGGGYTGGGGYGSGMPGFGSGPTPPTIPSSIPLTMTADVQQLLNSLKGISGQSLEISPTDPIIKNQTDIFNAREQQAMRAYLGGLAEQAGPNSNLSAEQRSANQTVGQATAEFEGRLMSQELNARRTQIMQALQMEGSLMTQEQQMALNAELTRINDALQLYGAQLGSSEFWAGMGQRAFEFDQGLQARYAGV